MDLARRLSTSMSDTVRKHHDSLAAIAEVAEKERRREEAEAARQEALEDRPPSAGPMRGADRAVVTSARALPRGLSLDADPLPAHAQPPTGPKVLLNVESAHQDVRQAMGRTEEDILSHVLGGGLRRMAPLNSVRRRRRRPYLHGRIRCTTAFTDSARLSPCPPLAPGPSCVHTYHTPGPRMGQPVIDTAAIGATANSA